MFTKIMISEFPICYRLKIAVFALATSWGLLLPTFSAAADLSVFDEPIDSAEANRVQIWFPVERDQNCRVTVEVIDDSGTVVRHLFDELLRRGYYNLYWDKKDDSGRFVAPGAYGYRVNDCGKIRTGEVEASFGFWELHSSVNASDSLPESEVLLSIDADSAVVSLEIRNRRGVSVDHPFADSVLTRGLHHLTWTPPRRGYGGWFEYRLTVGDYIRSGRIIPTYPPDSSVDKRPFR